MNRLAFLGIAVFALLVPCSTKAEEKTDLEAIHRIKTEALENSKVMDHAFYLTDVYGPRLTGTPGFQKAADWTVEQLKKWGLSNVAQEKWGPFGRGWAYSRFSAHMIEPSYAPLIGFPLAWSKSLNGPLAGEPVLAALSSEADFEKWKGKLKGKIVLVDAPRPLALGLAPNANRYSEAELDRLEQAPEPGASAFGPPSGAPAATPGGPRSMEDFRRLARRLREFCAKEEVALVVRIGRGEGGTVFGQSFGSQDAKEPLAVPAVVLNVEHYNRIARLLDKKVPVKLEFEAQSQVFDSNLDSFNIVAEIPGTTKKDEVVMIGAHFDSWHGGTGATDNAAGSAVMMEVMRILKEIKMPMKRTVRIALWSAEEHGLYGSKAYVKAHFADPEKMQPLAEHAKLAAYFNYDNGTGKIRGIYTQGNDMVRPIFESWLKPLRDLGASRVTNRNTGGTDHLSFTAVGLPGFQFIQDQVEYNTKTHHSNMDVYDRLQKGDLMQAAAVVASFVYQAANRDEMLPRVPLPKPRPAREERRESGERPPSGAAAGGQ